MALSRRVWRRQICAVVVLGPTSQGVGDRAFIVYNDGMVMVADRVET